MGGTKKTVPRPSNILGFVSPAVGTDSVEVWWRAWLGTVLALPFQFFIFFLSYKAVLSLILNCGNSLRSKLLEALIFYCYKQNTM